MLNPVTILPALQEDLKDEAAELVARFLTELPYVDGKPMMLTPEAKECAIVAAKWMRDNFSGHKSHYTQLIKTIREL